MDGAFVGDEELPTFEDPNAPVFNEPEPEPVAPEVDMEMFGFAGGAEPAAVDDDDDDDEEFVEEFDEEAGLSGDDLRDEDEEMSDEEAAAIEAAFRAQQEADDVD